MNITNASVVAEKIKEKFSQTKEPNLYNFDEIYEFASNLELMLPVDEPENIIVIDGCKYLKPVYAKTYFYKLALLFYRELCKCVGEEKSIKWDDSLTIGVLGYAANSFSRAIVMPEKYFLNLPDYIPNAITAKNVTTCGTIYGNEYAEYFGVDINTVKLRANDFDLSVS